MLLNCLYFPSPTWNPNFLLVFSFLSPLYFLSFFPLSPFFSLLFLFSLLAHVSLLSPLSSLTCFLSHFLAHQEDRGSSGTHFTGILCMDTKQHGTFCHGVPLNRQKVSSGISLKSAVVSVQMPVAPSHSQADLLQDMKPVSSEGRAGFPLENEFTPTVPTPLF